MSETIANQIERPKRFHFEWVLPVLFQPRRVFPKIAAQSGRVWSTPMLILSVLILAQVLVAGSIKQKAALAGGPSLPPDFQYFSPEQQAQYMKAMQATSSPVFLYVFPAITGLGAIWVGWLLISGIIHLVLTFIGGRGDTGSALNLVAWAGLPFGLRALVRVAYMLVTHTLIISPGLSGLISSEATDGMAYLAQLLALIDIYVIWNIILLVIGLGAGNNLPLNKAIASALLTICIILAAQALLGFLGGKFSNLTIIRPFF